ncbi:MAG: hypothetical protein M3P44_11675 [Actinomycetota bacterium]|nr:hypothetical protein [Actinomycetota bacterium]
MTASGVSPSVLTGTARAWLAQIDAILDGLGSWLGQQSPPARGLGSPDRQQSPILVAVHRLDKHHPGRRVGMRLGEETHQQPAVFRTSREFAKAFGALCGHGA